MNMVGTPWKQVIFSLLTVKQIRGEKYGMGDIVTPCVIDAVIETHPETMEHRTWIIIRSDVDRSMQSCFAVIHDIVMCHITPWKSQLCRKYTACYIRRH